MTDWEELSHSWPLGNALSPQEGSYRTRLELNFFQLRDGSFVELAECEVPRQGRWTMYICALVNVGKQNDDWVGGDAVEVGARFRPFGGETALTASAAYSVFGTLVGIIACKRSEEPGMEDTCPRTRLPMEGFVSVGAETTLPFRAMDIIASTQLRYHGSFSGDVGYEAPQGPAVSFGVGLAFR